MHRLPWRLPASAALFASLFIAVPLQGQMTQEEARLIRLVPDPAELVLEVGQTVPLQILAFDMQGNRLEDVTLRLSAPRTGVFVRGGEATGREVGTYTIHVSIVTPDGPRSVPASVYVDDPPPGMPRGPQPVLGIPVTVVPPSIARVEVTSRWPTLYPGTRGLHEVRGIHRDGTLRSRPEVRWSSSDPSVATVDRHGQVDVHAPGGVTITAEVDGVQGTLTHEVREFPARGIELAGGVESAQTGEVIRFEARTTDSSGAPVDAPVEWFYLFTPHDTVMARGGGADLNDGIFVAQVPGIYSVVARSGPLQARSTVEIHPRQVLHRAHVLGRGVMTHDRMRDFWVFEGSDGGDYAITGGPGFAYVWDVTDPTGIQLIDSVFVDARTINDVKVSPDARYAVLTREGASDRRNGVVLLDLADPRRPVVASEATEGLTGGVHNAWPENDYLYALSGGERYVIIDMADIYAPRVVGEYNHPRSSIHDVIVHDGLAYSSEWENGIVVVDVGNGRWGGSPSNPVFVTQIHFPEMLTHTVWPYEDPETGRLYLFASDELWPRVGSPLEGFADGEPFDPVTGEGGRPAHTGGYVHVIDFTDPERPEKVARYQMDEYGVHNPWVEDGVLYQAYYEGGVRIVDVSGELRGDLRKQGREMVVFKPYDPEGFIANAPMVWSAMPFKGNVFFSDANSGLWAVRIEPRGARPIF